MNKDNSKVPVAILSCFLIAFILQGVLKISGVFIFEKALGWEIFHIIDNNRVANIIYQIFIMTIKVYCLSFVLTPKPYSKKWYVYLIILLGCVGVLSSRMLIKTPMFMEFIYDISLYVGIPIIVNILENKNIFKHSISQVIPHVAIHIMLYFLYLGLTYWSILLCSLIPVTQTIVNSSKVFLINFEVYIALLGLLFVPIKLKYKGD